MQKWHAGNWCPGLARKTGTVADFGKVEIKKKESKLVLQGRSFEHC